MLIRKRVVTFKVFILRRTSITPWHLKKSSFEMESILLGCCMKMTFISTHKVWWKMTSGKPSNVESRYCITAVLREASMRLERLFSQKILELSSNKYLTNAETIPSTASYWLRQRTKLFSFGAWILASTWSPGLWRWLEQLAWFLLYAGATRQAWRLSLASHVRKMVTVFLFDEFDGRRSSDGIG